MAGTSVGTKTSFSNTPQAADDSYFWTEDDLLASNSYASVDSLHQNVLTLNVMANDLGGNAKSLFSIDDGNGHTSLADYDLLSADTNGVWESTSSGNQIRIYNGQIQVDLSHSLGLLGATNVNALAAGDSIHDEFVYAVRLGNGTLSQAKVTVDIQGQNDAAVITGDRTGLLTEDSTIPAAGVLTIIDPDHGQSRSQVASGTTALGSSWSVDANGHWSYTVNNAAVQHLNAAETATDTFSVASLDGTASQPVTITIQGENDAPLVVGTVTGPATEDGPTSALNALANVSDVDDNTLLSVVNLPAALPAGVTYSSITQNFTLDPSNAAYQYLAQGQTATVTANYGVSDGIATTADAASWIVTGTNDAPVLQSLVGTGESLTDSLTLSGVMAFSDVDLRDTHIVTITPQGQHYAGTIGETLTDSTGMGQGRIELTYHLTQSEYQAVFGNSSLPNGYHQDYLVTVDDHHGGTSSQLVSVPLAQILSGIGGGGGGGSGPDHPPVFTYSSTSQIPGGNAFVWDDPTATTLTTTGFLQFSDPDNPNSNDVHHLQVTPAAGNWGHLSAMLDSEPSNTNPGNIQWQYAVNEPVAEQLAAGEVHLDQFTFTLTDSGGLSTSTTVGVLINGADQAPILQPETTVIQGLATDLLHLSGSFTFSDPDISDRHSLSFQSPPYQPIPNAFGGTFSATLVHDTVNGLGGEVDWTYSPDPVSLQALGEGESMSLPIPVAVNGILASSNPVIGPGMSSTEYIQLTAYGVNDSPYFVDPPASLSASPVAGTSTPFEFDGSIFFGDPDIHDTHFAYAVFDPTLSSTATEIGHLSAFVQDDSVGAPNTHGIIRTIYDLPTSAFADTAPAHQVYDIVLQDNHGLQTTQQYTFDLTPLPH